ncbi:MAG: exopolysaccharide biosynthesis polyprenyl glycosylphosphotransferase [Firmicutes bacterium]|nr:exopolysaccharide biosynthesis polyprenyl glycosylphosphotransferase [Bacillota bacterium]
MLKRLRSYFRRAKTDILIGAMSFALYILLGFVFFYCLSLNNPYLVKISRTLATTLLTFTAMTVAMHAVYGGYDVGHKKNKPVISALISAVFITDLVSYVQMEIMNVNENNKAHLTLFGTDLLFLLLCYVIQVVIIILFVRLGNQLYFHFTPPLSCLLILGDPEQEAALRSKIGQYKLQWRVDDVAMFYSPDLKERIDRADIVFLGQLPFGAKFTLLKMCYDDRKDVMCKAEMEEIMLCNARPAIVDDAAFLSMKYNKITMFQRIVKRLGDIIISLLALIVFSPFILLISLMIKLEDGGPVIFKQDRLTLAGRPFTIRKFRTMVPHDEPQDDLQVSVAEDDPRITKVGSFLRRYRLDEIPQFLNILSGEMSLVGPRPEMMANVTRYKMDLPAFVYREKMKAGLTGYAQIEGRYNTSAEDKLMLDMMYIESFSIWLDVKLLLRTFTLILKKDSTQGFQKSPGSNINEPVVKESKNQ